MMPDTTATRSQVAMFCPVGETSSSAVIPGAKTSKKDDKSIAKQTPQQVTQTPDINPAPGSWSYLDYKRVHTHDVRAMDVVKLPDGR